MSDDIVERLRNCGPFLASDGYMSTRVLPSSTAHEAADEIERLRARIQLTNTFLNDVLGVARNVEQNQVFAVNLSHNSSVALPPEYNDLWEATDE